MNTALAKEVDARNAGLAARAKAKGLDALVLDRRADIFYLTGYTGSDAVLVLPVGGKKAGWLVTDSRYEEEGRKTAPGVETLVWRDEFSRFVGQLLKKEKLIKIGYTPTSMTADFFARMRRAAGSGTIWTGVEEILTDLRSVKSAYEIKAMRKALHCAETAFAASRARWKIGMTEQDVKNDLEWEMRRYGAEDTSFETIVAVGANASLPHAHAGKGKIAAGKMLLIDFGAQVDRYCSDLTRTLWAGDVPAKWLARYRAVLEAQLAGIAAVRPGATGREVDEAARQVLRRHDLEDMFTHGLGHGIGLVVHENPRLSRVAVKELAPGNISSVEPGVYFPGSGGIRVEDLILVGKKGAEVLSTLPKDVGSLVF